MLAGSCYRSTGQLCREVCQRAHSRLHPLPVSIYWFICSYLLMFFLCYLVLPLIVSPCLDVCALYLSSLCVFFWCYPSLSSLSLPGLLSWPPWGSGRACGCKTSPWTCGTFSALAMTFVSGGSRVQRAHRPASFSCSRGTMIRLVLFLIVLVLVHTVCCLTSFWFA